MTAPDPTRTVTHSSTRVSRTSQDADHLAVTVVWHVEPRFCGSRRVVRQGTSVELGRHSDVLGAGVCDDSRLSRQHVRLTAAAGHLLVEDLNSRNGLRVGGVRVPSAELSVGDSFRIGRLVLVVHRAPMLYREPEHPELIGRSAVLARLIDSLERASSTTGSVLIRGETGVGKELVARAVHRSSGRSGRLVAVNCGELVGGTLMSVLFGHRRGAFTGAQSDQVGLVGHSDGGTLFLDEIGDATPELQVALLRLLESGRYRPVGASAEREANTRVIAATHRDIDALVQSGHFRQDLAERLRGWELVVPPLRERPDDIVLLARHLAAENRGEPVELTARLTERLLAHPWPGNVRELAAMIRRLCASGPGPLDVSEALEGWLSSRAAPGTEQPLAQRKPRFVGDRPDEAVIRDTLVQTSGNVNAAARALSVGRATLYRWLKAFDIDPDDYRYGRE